MADVISFGSFETMQEIIAEGNSMVSGMSAAEAEAALGATTNSGLYVYNATSAAGAGNVINFPNAANAAEAAAEFIAEGGTTSASGAAVASTGAAEQAVNMALGQTSGAQAATSVYGVLSMPLPTAAAALAPVAGFTLGAALYESNPTLWTQISRALLPFCYDDSELLKVTVDEYGNTYYPYGAIQAMKAISTELVTGEVPADNPVGVPAFSFQAGFTGNFITYPSHYEFPLVNANVVARNSQSALAAVTNPNYITNAKTYTYQGKTVYYWEWRGFDMSATGIVAPAQPQLADEDSALVAWISWYGSERSVDTNGTAPWTGQEYPPSSTPVNMLTGYDQQGNPIYTPYYPVSTPIGDPGVSNDPAVNPNPSVNPNPNPAINPYINPVPNPSYYPTPVIVPGPAPLPNPVPSPQPVPGPDRDPSRDPDPDEVPDDPETPDGGKDTGDSTPPIIPIVPITPASGASLLHVYNPTQSQIDAFGSWLWTTWSDASIWQTIQKLFNDPMDGIIGLHELYATPALNGSGTIRCGYMDSGVNSALVGTRYTTINCGTIVVEEYYQNYLDYSPYTQVYVYLPFIGIMPLSADDIIGNAVNIKYHVDSYTGCCIATITVARSGYSSTVYQFEGNCAVEIPITSGYQSALMSGLLAVAGTAISGNPSVGLTAAHVGRAGLGKNAVQHSGSFGSSFGAMGAKIPYIIVRRPVQKKVNNYSLSYGYPAHKMVYVGNCQGYLRVREVRVMSTTATNIEKEMIVAALKEGVYVR